MSQVWEEKKYSWWIGTLIKVFSHQKQNKKNTVILKVIKY